MIITALIILFILLFVLVAVLTFARNVLVAFLSSVVGLFHKKDQMHKKNDGRQTIRKRKSPRKKVYSDSDGEYVDFEEIKK